MKTARYSIYSTYLKERYGEKVYKIPINLPLTCPNRDGVLGSGGCSFCGEIGTGFENLSNTLSVEEQLKTNIDYIKDKYKANKYIAYFQNFSNTYLPLSKFKEYINAACIKDIVEISISTRPDCVNDEYLSFLKEIKEQRGINIIIELGLQSVNYHTLNKVNRGHGLAEFIDASSRVKKYGLESCVHMILNLPWDTMEDVVEGAKIISALEIDQVKLHSLYILKDTSLGRMYETDSLELISLEEYVGRVISFIEHISPKVVIQRLVGRAPKEDTLFCNWNTSWWKIKDLLDAELEKRNSFQGARFDYLNGKAVRTLSMK